MSNSDFLLRGLGLDDLYARVRTTGTTSFLADALGSTVALTDGGGVTTATYAYEPYGKTTVMGTDDTAFRFTGREDDGATNLYYYRARYYSPQLGRFISQDPLGLFAGPNLYAYARGNPVSRRDPLGLEDQADTPTPPGVNPNPSGASDKGQAACDDADSQQEHLDKAAAALAKGDWKTYQSEIDSANRFMRYYYRDLGTPLNPADYGQDDKKP